MPDKLARQMFSILALTGALLVPALVSTPVLAADMVEWQGQQRAPVARHQREMHVHRAKYTRPWIQECEFLRIDCVAGGREVVRVCHPPVF